MRVCDSIIIPPSENMTLPMSSYYNNSNILHYSKNFDPSIGDFIEMEIYTKESQDDLGLFNLYQNLRIEFLQKYNQYYPNIPWVSIFNNQKNP
jgi:hypothetical protein